MAINDPSAGNQRSISWQSMGKSGAIEGQSVLITCAAPPDGPLCEGGASGRSPLALTRRAPVRARRARPRRRASSPHECERTCNREANQLQSVLISTNRHQSARISRNESVAISHNQSLSLDGGRAVLKQQRERIVTEEQAHLHATPSVVISGNCNGRAGSPACNAIRAHQW